MESEKARKEQLEMEDAAKELKKAMKGIGLNESAIWPNLFFIYIYIYIYIYVCLNWLH